MGRVVYEPCPKCRESGRDRRGDNLGRYPDGSGHCFSCGHHELPSGIRRLHSVTERLVSETETALPRDFTREVPAAAWRWLLQYGLPYSYWKPYVGWSPSYSRLVITHGNPVETSVGRFIDLTPGSAEVVARHQDARMERDGERAVREPSTGIQTLLDGGVHSGNRTAHDGVPWLSDPSATQPVGQGLGRVSGSSGTQDARRGSLAAAGNAGGTGGTQNTQDAGALRLRAGGEGRLQLPRKWLQWGEKSRTARILEHSGTCTPEGIVCVVEDIISAHKVAQCVPCLPLFGTALYPKALSALRALKRPVALWLDSDQAPLLAPKINRLQTFLDVPVRVVKTRKDPKEYSTEEISEILAG